MFRSKAVLTGPFRHGLTFIATLAFMASFFGSRLFATLYPDTVVMTGEIHIHHFWYGIGLLSVAGWLAIAWRTERLSRLCAVLYGLGAGFVGDEVGLLLTFGDYWTELTYQFFIAAMSLVIIVTLLLRYRAVVLRDVLKLSLRERIILVGVFLAGFSAFLLFIPPDSLIAIPFILAGLTIMVFAYARMRRPGSHAVVADSEDRSEPLRVFPETDTCWERIYPTYFALPGSAEAEPSSLPFLRASSISFA